MLMLFDRLMAQRIFYCQSMEHNTNERKLHGMFVVLIFLHFVCRYFMYRKIPYVWLPSAGIFDRIRTLDTHVTLRALHSCKEGITTKEVFNCFIFINRDIMLL
jgi:hypothetical protein